VQKSLEVYRKAVNTELGKGFFEKYILVIDCCGAVFRGD
jgi:hypothetical protein